ncbi:hypothetical protein RRG08_040403 [Elysia crispata]|uniref:Uncharacterized protein n=1 Tax=Elysia crispata TaxID=231223 RepID=A0AAE0XSZ2_9GAST|nr:hypothetical protein RRG08_040403 [Elysia crispata]
MQPISTNRSSNLWRLHDEIQANVGSLENLGVDGSTYGVVLTPLVLRQLPTHIRLEWARIGEGQEGNLTFHDEIRRKERDHRLSTRCQTHRLVGVPDTLVCLNPRNTIKKGVLG